VKKTEIFIENRPTPSNKVWQGPWWSWSYGG